MAANNEWVVSGGRACKVDRKISGQRSRSKVRTVCIMESEGRNVKSINKKTKNFERYKIVLKER